MNMDKIIERALLKILLGDTEAYDTKEPPLNMRDDWVGKYVICRTRNEGVNAGEVVALDHTGVVIKNARRLWHHAPSNKGVSWYEGVAEFGLSEGSKVSTPSYKILSEDYSLTLCSKAAQKSIIDHETHKSS